MRLTESGRPTPAEQTTSSKEWSLAMMNSTTRTCPQVAPRAKGKRGQRQQCTGTDHKLKAAAPNKTATATNYILLVVEMHPLLLGHQPLTILRYRHSLSKAWPLVSVAMRVQSCGCDLSFGNVWYAPLLAMSRPDPTGRASGRTVCSKLVAAFDERSACDRTTGSSLSGRSMSECGDLLSNFADGLRNMAADPDAEALRVYRERPPACRVLPLTRD